MTATVTAAVSGDRMSVVVIGIRDVRFEALCGEHDHLLEEWLELWSGQPAARRVAWSHPAWITTWLDTYGRASGMDFRLFFVRRGTTLVGVFALRVVPPLVPAIGGWRLELVDDSVLSGADPTLRDDAASDAVEALLRVPLPEGASVRLLTLRPIDETSPLLMTGHPGLSVKHVRRSCIKLADSHAAFLSSLGRNFRGNLRKARNKLRAAGEVQVETLEAPHEMESGLARFTAVEARSWKGSAGSTMGGTPMIMALYGRALMRLAEAGLAVVHILRVNERDAGAMISMIAGETLFVQKIGYDEALAALAPGNLLLEAVIRDYCAARGLIAVNLVTDSDWHRNWRPSVVQTFEVYFACRGFRGTVSAWLMIPLRKRLKRLLLAMRQGAASRDPQEMAEGAKAKGSAGPDCD